MSAFDSMITQGFSPEAALKITMESIAKYGEEPCTREQAAAHEAGHWVIGDTLGLAPYRRLRLFKRDGLWLGENIEVHPTEAHVEKEPNIYKACALQVIGGFMGEVVAGHGHPASSIDERTNLVACCCTLSRVYGGRPDALLAAALVVAAEIIHARRADFDLVRHHLEKERCILRHRLDHLSRPNPEPWLSRWHVLAATHGTDKHEEKHDDPTP